jgi:hypothetical protein
MLRDLLSEFEGQSALSTSSLAASVGVNESLLIQMLEELVRNEYLEENAQCSAACAACTQASHCKPTKVEPQRMWVLSAKGRKLLQQA